MDPRDATDIGSLTRVQIGVLLMMGKRTLDQKPDVILVLLDQSAAFEIIDHRILLHRLPSRFGLTENVQKWFESKLCNRMEFVSSQSSVSESSKSAIWHPSGVCFRPIAIHFVHRSLGGHSSSL